MPDAPDDALPEWADKRLALKPGVHMHFNLKTACDLLRRCVPFMEHHRNCATDHDSTLFCTCGLSALLARIEEMDR